MSSWCSACGDPAKGQSEESAQEGALGSAGASVPGSAAETSTAALGEVLQILSWLTVLAGLRLTKAYYQGRQDCSHSHGDESGARFPL